MACDRTLTDKPGVIGSNTEKVTLNLNIFNRPDEPDKTGYWER
jgi:hypothetical protein